MNRIAVTAAVAVMLASLSLTSVIATPGWVVTGAGAVAVVAIAGALMRLPRMPSAVIATFLVLIALVPLLTKPDWGDRSGALVILVITALSATGAWPLRGFAVLAGYLAALLLYLNMTFAHAVSFGWLVPSDSSISALTQLWRDAFVVFHDAPPVTDFQSVKLVTAAGIGAVAIAVDIFAVRLRRPAVAGLPLLLLFSVPVASNLKVFGAPEMIVFAAGLAGYLALLSADGRERLRMWGRLVTFRHVQAADETGSGPDTRELSASGRRIGLAAVCLAIVVPLVLPAMRVRDVFATTPNGAGHGSGTASLSPLLNVQRLLTGKTQPVLSYTTTAKHPGEQYLQAYVLNYNEREQSWQPTYAGSRAFIAPNLPWTAQGAGRTSVTKVTTKVTISKDDTGEAFLPIPYAADRLDVAGSGWLETRGSLMVFNPAVNMSGLQYTVQSEEADPPPNDIPSTLPLPTDISSQYATYTGPDYGRLWAIADRHINGATSQLQAAVNLENWFTSAAFSYSLKPDLPTKGWLLPFLTTHRSGFCSQFAQAFAILARVLGIPARVAIGYTGGTQGPGNTWKVTTADAHAWPELYFPGEGWLRFEPTPSGLNGQGTAEVPAYAGGTASSTGQVSNLKPHNPVTGQGPTPRGSRGHLPVNRDHPLGGSGAPGLTKPANSHIQMWLAIALPVALFLLVGWPAMIRLLTRRRRWFTATGDAGIARAAWRELTDDLADFGLGCAPGETPRSVARRVIREARLGETAAQAISRLAAAEERAQYARLPGPGTGLRTAEVTVRRAIASSVSRKQRLRARLLPASTLLAARHLFQRASEMLSWLDSSWPTLRRQLLRTAAHGTEYQGRPNPFG